MHTGVMMVVSVKGGTMSDYGVGGYFTDSDIWGTDPSAHEVHVVLPHGPEPHVWETPSHAWDDANQMRWEFALQDARTRSFLATPSGPPLSQESLRRSWEFDHPVRAALIRWLNR